MFRKCAIQQVQPEPRQFLSNLFFLVDNRDGDHRPAKNLKYLKYFTPYHHFKMEGMLKGNNFTFPYKKLLCLIILFKEENM